MQHSPFLVLAVAATLAGPAFAAHAPDSLLDGAPNGPCVAQASGPSYAPGVDAEGYPVVPADVGAPPVAIPDQVIVPLPGGDKREGHHRGRDDHWRRDNNNKIGPYAVIDGRRLEGLLNSPGCGNPPPPPPARGRH